MSLSTWKWLHACHVIKQSKLFHVLFLQEVPRWHKKVTNNCKLYKWSYEHWPAWQIDLVYPVSVQLHWKLPFVFVHVPLCKHTGCTNSHSLTSEKHMLSVIKFVYITFYAWYAYISILTISRMNPVKPWMECYLIFSTYWNIMCCFPDREIQRTNCAHIKQIFKGRYLGHLYNLFIPHCDLLLCDIQLYVLSMEINWASGDHLVWHHNGDSLRNHNG